MFTFDSKVAKQNCTDSKDDVLIFIVRLDNGRNLPVYLSASGYSYGCLKCVGYAE